MGSKKKKSKKKKSSASKVTKAQAAKALANSTSAVNTLSGDFTNSELVPIGQAAEILGVSVDTVRRWDKAGILSSSRPDGKNRHFSIHELEQIKLSQPLTISEASEQLGISQDTLRRLEKKGLVKPERNEKGDRVYVRRDLEKILHSEYFMRKREMEDEVLEPLMPGGGKDNKRKVSAGEHDTTTHALLGEHHINISDLQRFRSMATTALKIIMITFMSLVAIITILFFLFPENSAKTFGYFKQAPQSTQYEFQEPQGLIARQLKPFSLTALRIVEVFDPDLRSEIAPHPAISDVNDILTPDENGNITSLYSFTVPDTSYLKIPDQGLVVNLNSDYLRGRVPGEDGGDLAILPLDGDKIKDGSIFGIDIADGSITQEKLAPGLDIGGDTVVVEGSGGGSGDIESVIAGAGLIGGGSSGSVTLDIVGGNGLLVNSNSIDLDVQTASNTSTTSSNSGLELTASGLRLLGGCSANQVLEWTGSAWACASNSGGGGGSQNLFETIATSSGTSPVADSANDTLSLNGSNGLVVTGDSSTDSIDFSLDVTTSGTTGTTSSNSGLELTASGLRLMGGCSTNQILKWNGSNWTCSADDSGGGGGGSSVWSDLQDPVSDLTLQHNELQTTFNWNTNDTTSGNFNGLNLTLTNDGTSDPNTQRLLVLKNENNGINDLGDIKTEALIRLEHNDDSTLDKGIEIIGSVSPGGFINTGLDVSDGNIRDAIDVGANNIAGTTADIEFDNLDFNGSFGILELGALAIYTGDGDTTYSSGGGGVLILDSSDGEIIVDDGDVLTLGSGSALGHDYHSISNAGGAANGGDVINDNDLYIQGSLEVDGNFNLGGDITMLGTNATTTGANLNLNIAGAAAGQLELADNDTINIGGITGTGYNAISNAGGSANSGFISDDNDLYVQGALEVDGNTNLGGNLQVLGSTINASTVTTFNCTDCLNYDDFSDSLVLDASTSTAFGNFDYTFNLNGAGDFFLQDSGSTFLTIDDQGAYSYILDSTDNPGYTITNNGSSNITNNLVGSGDFVIQDNGVTFVNFDDSGSSTFTQQANSKILIDASSTANSASGGVLDVDVASSSANHSGFNLTYQLNAGAASGANQYASRIDILNSDNDADLYGMLLTALGGGPVNPGAVECLYCAENQENQVGYILDAFRVSSTAGTEGSITNGINFATTDIATDINLQNGETIDNNTDGTVLITSPVTQFSGIALVGDGSGNDYLSFVEESTNPVCGVGEYKIWANSTENLLKKCQNGALSDLDAAGAWNQITPPVGDLSLSHQEFITDFTWDTGSTAAAKDYWTFSVNNDATTDSNTQQVVVIRNNDDGLTTGSTESLLNIDNADVNESVADALLITSAAGGITDALDLSDADILNALNVGANIITGTDWTIAATSDVAEALTFDLEGGVGFDIAGAAGQDFKVTNTGGSVVLDSSEAASDALRLIASAASGGIDIDSGTSGVTIDTTGSISLDANTTSNFSVTGANQILNLQALGGGASQAIVINSAGSGAAALNLDSSGGIEIDAVSGIAINSSGGFIAIGNDNVNQNIQIGTAGSRTVTIGNTSGTTGLVFETGTGNTTITTDNITLTKDTNFTLSGGVNGASFDTDTLSIDAANDRVAVGSTAPTRTFDVTGNWGGNNFTSNRTDSTNQTETVTTEALAYHLTNDSGAADTTTVFNITGLPDINGTFAFIYTSATDSAGGISGNQAIVNVQVNGVQVSSVASPGLGSGTTIESYTLVRTNNTWKVIGTPGTANNADLAEWTPATSPKPAPGEVVSMSSDDTRVTLSSRAYDNRLVGVVSTAPHTTMGPKTHDSVRLALAGRVPVKVSTENGAIQPGDYLTSSSIPGVAMKATKASYTIGIAMQAYEGDEVGTVMTFVRTGWFGGSTDASVPEGLEALVTANQDIDFDINDLGSLNVTDSLLAGIKVVTPQLVAEQADVDTINPIHKALKINLAEDKSLDVVNSEDELVSQINSSGDAFFAGGLESDSVRANQVVGTDIGQKYYASDDASYGDVVALVDGVGKVVRKSQAAYEPVLIGVVSRSPSLVIGTSDSTSSGEVIVAASGVVPVNVNNQGGSIKPGDPLTSSSKPGQAMKANSEGPIIGVAASRFDGESGTVLVRISSGFGTGNIAEEVDQLGGRVDTLETEVNGIKTTQTTSPAFDLDNFTVDNAVVKANLTIGEGLVVGGDTTFKGQTFFHKLAVFVEKVVFRNDVSFEGHVAFNSDTAGFAMVETGKSRVSVEFDKPYDTPPVVTLTPGEGKFAGYSYENLTRTGFDIVLDAPAGSDTTFSWIALAVNNIKVQK